MTLTSRFAFASPSPTPLPSLELRVHLSLWESGKGLLAAPKHSGGGR